MYPVSNYSAAYAKANHLWSYGGKIVIMSRHMMNAAAKNSEWVKSATTRLKLFSIVGVPFSLVSIKCTAEKIFESYQATNHEHVGLGMLSLTIMVADVMDSGTTFANAVLSLSGRAPVGIFTAMALPLAVTMTSLGSLSRLIQIAKSFPDKKKVAIEGMGLAANALTGAALYMFKKGAVGSTPFVLLSTSFFIRITSLMYQDLTK